MSPLCAEGLRDSLPLSRVFFSPQLLLPTFPLPPCLLQGEKGKKKGVSPPAGWGGENRIFSGEKRKQIIREKDQPEKKKEGRTRTEQENTAL